MSAIDSNISGGDFITQANGAVQGLNLLTDDSAASVISKLNTAFTNVTGKRTIVDKKAADFIGDVNYNIDLMDSGEQPTTEKIILPSDHIPKLLFIGNSLSLDTISYLPFILKAHNIDAVVGIVFRHGQSVTWYNSKYNGAESENINPRLYVLSTSESTPVWHEIGSKQVSGEWVFINPHSAITATTSSVHSDKVAEATAVGLDGTWDFVSIQPFDPDQSDGVLEEQFPSLVTKIKNDIGDDFILGLTLPHSIVGGTTPRRVMKRASDLLNGYSEIDAVLPDGTAICNALAHEEFRSMKSFSDYVLRTQSTTVNYSGRMFYGDQVEDANHNHVLAPLHLNEGLPCYIAALAVAHKLMQSIDFAYSNYDGLEITGSEIMPPVNGVYPSGSDWSAWSSAINVKNPNGQNCIFGIDGVSSSPVMEGTIGSLSRAMAVWCAKQAVKYPLDMPTLTYHQESPDVTITVVASNCTVRVGSASGNNAAGTYDYYTQFITLYVVPNTGYIIQDAYWTSSWRHNNNMVEGFKVNFNDTGNGIYSVNINNLHENITIVANATSAT